MIPLVEVGTRPQLPTVAGFRFAGVASGIKARDQLDLGLIAADELVPTAAVFTQNRVRAAPVDLSKERVQSGRCQAVVVNSGNANACTGTRGMRDARAMTSKVAKGLRCRSEDVLVTSTGVIGVPLPLDKITRATGRLCEELTADGVDRFSYSVLTTDRWPKVACAQVKLTRSTSATILGVAKGAGMIHPNLATTLGFVVTDVRIAPSRLRTSLRRAVDETFNALTVDGETSTNDTIVAMASGRVMDSPIRSSSAVDRRFQSALREVLGNLGQSIVRDGEGARKLVRLRVEGASHPRAARAVAARVAGSLLVKTAIFGGDPNWGRIVSAAGAAGVSFDPSKVEVRIGKVVVTRRGAGVPQAEEAAARVMSESDYTITLKIGRGSASAHYDFCDVGHPYVDINSAYRT